MRTEFLCLVLPLLLLVGQVFALENEGVAREPPFRYQADFGFIGEGFHVQFYIDLHRPVEVNHKTEDAMHVELNLPRAYFVDIPEVEQMCTLFVDGATSDGGIAARCAMSSQYIFDIEAPIFRTEYETNLVKLDVTLPAVAQHAKVIRVQFPMHTRYEVVDTTRPFSWDDFLYPLEGSHKLRCIESSAVQITMPNHGEVSVVTNEAVGPHRHCIAFPQGILSHLPVVYRLTMGLLAVGSLFVFLMMHW